LDIPTKRIIGRTKLGKEVHFPIHASDPAGPVFDENALNDLKFRSKAIFSPNQRDVVVMALGRVWLLDGGSCSLRSSIDLPRFRLVAPVDIRAVSNSLLAVTYEYGWQQFEVDFYNLPTGVRAANWLSSTIPQSFSPDGRLWVGPDPMVRNSGGVTNVQIADVRTGVRQKSIPVGFHFSKTWFGLFGTPTAKGEIVSQFLNNEQIVVIPDDERDGGGANSGDSLVIIDIAHGRIEREIHPRHFRPTGVIAESLDRSHFAVESLYASNRSFRIESDNPVDFRHEVMVFATGGTAPELVFRVPDDQMVDEPLKISADASLIAFEANGAVLLFKVKE
jgi:hypothetical protein